MKRYGWLLVAGLLSGIAPVAGLVNSALPQAEEGEWAFDAQLRLRVESRDNRDFNSNADDERTNFLTRARLGATLPAGRGWSFRWLIQDSEAWDPVTSTQANEAQLEVQELFANYQSDDLSVMLGRVPLAYGRERLVGTFEWSNVARRFDGLKVGWNFGEVKLDGWFTSLGGSPSTFAADGEFWGLYSTWPKMAGGQTEAYLFWNHDPSPAPAPTNFFTLGGRREARHGPWRYEVEAAGQFGNVTAYAAALEGGYTTGPVDLTLGFNTASGDSTPGIGQATTFQNLFPTNHNHYGIMDYQSWRNMHNLYGKLAWQAEPWLKLETGFQAFWLANSRDFWYGASGAPNRTTGGLPYIDPSGASGSAVGQEFDLVLTANPHAQLRLQAGYAHFFSGRFIDSVNTFSKLNANDSDFWYVEALGRY